jgi:hypothetical protein
MLPLRCQRREEIGIGHEFGEWWLCRRLIFPHLKCDALSLACNDDEYF